MNIALLLTMAADALADRCAISDGGRHLGYADLRDDAAAFAASLRDEAGTVVYAGPVTAATPIALFGSTWAGRSFAPLNHRLPDQSLVRLAEGLAPAQAVTSADHLDALDAVLPGARLDDDLLGAGADVPITDPVESPLRPAVLLYTSGTSAAPKAAALGHENLLSYIWNTVEFATAGVDEAALISVPSFHIAGIAALLSNVYAGRRVVTMATFNPEAWLQRARVERVTHAFVVPTMLARIVEVMKRQPELRVPSLRVLSYGGARMPLPVLEEALRLFAATDFVNAYGLTETSSTVALLTPDDHRRARDGDEIARRRLASVGRPLPGIEIEIVDDAGRSLPHDLEGRLRIRGSQVGGTYLDGSSAMGDDEWLLTGDRGRIDVDGYVWVLGREDDVLIRGGENITPAEIEDTLLRHPAIAQAVVVGLPDATWGEQIAAALVVHPGHVLTAQEVREHVQASIGTFKTPATVVFLGDLPMTPSGKLLRRAVREQLLADRSLRGVDRG